MIVPMKNVMLLALASEESLALTALRDLGVMQIVPGTKRSSATQNSADAAANAARILNNLTNLGQTPAGKADAVRGREILASAAGLFDECAKLENAVTSLKQQLKRLAPWGSFDRKMLDELSSKGIFVILCSGTQEDLQRAENLEKVSLQIINREKNSVDFAAIFTEKPDAETLAGLPVFRLSAEDNPEVLNKNLTLCSKKLDAAEAQLNSLAAELPSVQAAYSELTEAAEFDRAADAMSEYGEIAVLNGYVPEPELPALREYAKRHGWGLLISTPGENENVPVLLKETRFTRIIKPLFDFLGIVPGYREIDVSGAVLVFFTMFYAIIIGDAGYGVLFTALSVFVCKLAKRRPALKLPARLLLILSITTTVWGALCGSWFGLEFIPGTATPFPALECFRNFSTDAAKQANVQLFCFILAVAQLSTGRIWKAISERNWRSTFEHLGWILIIWGNFFLTIRLIVYPGSFPQFMYYLYGAGLLMVVTCGVKWNQVADVFQFPFNIIGSFTDVLSYIRLFAVSLSGACIASSFNGMAFDICKVSNWLLPAGALVMLLGHGLNLALALMGVLVHAVRLNTLEFSNHAGLSWSGQKFQPFKKNTDKSEEC